MLYAVLFVSLALLCPQLHVEAQMNTVAGAIQHSQNTLRIVKMILEEKLPPNSEAREAGNDIVNDLQYSLKVCDDAITVGQIEEHYKCVEGNKNMALSSIGELAGRHWASSGASRPGLFW